MSDKLTEAVAKTLFGNYTPNKPITESKKPCKPNYEAEDEEKTEDGEKTPVAPKSNSTKKKAAKEKVGESRNLDAFDRELLEIMEADEFEDEGDLGLDPNDGIDEEDFEDEEMSDEEPQDAEQVLSDVYAQLQAYFGAGQEPDGDEYYDDEDVEASPRRVGESQERVLGKKGDEFENLKYARTNYIITDKNGNRFKIKACACDGSVRQLKLDGAKFEELSNADTGYVDTGSLF
jgi:hypothetical protein